MKKIFLMLTVVLMAVLTASATDLTGKRIYLNPGHGSFGPNDRPMPTIPYPNLPSTGMPDTMGFYESNTDMWKCDYVCERLRESGAYVMMSRTTSGPWPYAKVNGDYPDYSWANYQTVEGFSAYNRSLSEICEEVEANNMDLFLSVHSNAATDGTTTNYPLFLFRGQDAKTTAFEQSSYNFGAALWPWRWEMFDAGFDQATFYSSTNMNIRGDWDFYGSHSASTRSNGQTYDGYLGVLKHGTVGGLVEGYFHTYQPARHRAINHDYCFMEGMGYYRAIMDYFQADPDPLGYICGTVKDMDQKMNHPLFKYTPKTNDQWVPCNGATVYLLNADGDTLQNYQVDDLYNGIFAFYDLTPGIYHLFATCPGYFDLDDAQATADVIVTANQTTYPFIQLRDTTWQPAAVVYETYPDRSTDVSGLDGKYNFGAAQTASFANVVAGKQVRQVLVRDDEETYVLALDTTTGAHASYIYKINTLTGALIQEVSTEGTQGQFYPVYNIAFTADSILVGGNFEECQFTPSGTFRTYYWNMEDLTAAPTAWFTSQWAGNFNHGEVGRTFSVSGALQNATVFTDAQTTGSSHQFRVASMTTDQMALVSVVRNQLAAEFTAPLFGDYAVLASPNSDERMILAGANRTIEMSYASDAQAPVINFDTDGCYGAGAMKYGSKSIVAAPVMQSGAVTGVKMYNMTDGMSQATLTTTNIQMSETTSYCSVKPLAQGKEIVIYVATDDQIFRYTTEGQQQPEFLNIFAYDLKAEQNGDNWEFSFNLNTEPESATVIISSEDGTELQRIAVADAAKGANTLSVAASELGELPLKWAVEASAPTVGNWKKAAGYTARSGRSFNAVNVYPETDNFGKIYMMNRVASGSTSNGLYILSPELVAENSTPYKGVQSVYSSCYRMGIASDGWVFASDWGDPHSGVYAIDPADPAGSHYNFFAGSQNSAGLWKNAAGVEEGSSTPSVYVYGTGADTKLLVYNEDPGSTLPTNGLCVYNIGQPDGTILHSWDGAPSAKMDFAGQANTNGNVWGCSHGVWVSQHRSAGNNNASATSLRFYSWDGECTFASYNAPVDQYELPIIEGSLGSCFALSADEKTLILRGVDYDFMVFDVAWAGNTPTLTLKSRVKNVSATNADYELLQMNWDYAGNLVVSGNDGLFIFAAPKDVNTCITPAKDMLAVPEFDHDLYTPAQAAITNTYFATGDSWTTGEASTAALDAETGDITVHIDAVKANQWQSQVFFTPGFDWEEGATYTMEFKLRTNNQLGGVTVKINNDGEGWYYSYPNDNFFLADQNTKFETGEFVAGAKGAGNGEIILAFGWVAAGTDIVISDIRISKTQDAPAKVYEHLYEIGDNQGWKPAEGIEMTGLGENVFIGTFTFTAETSYFAFTTEKTDDWNVINANRFGGAENNQLVADGTVADLAAGEFCLTIAPGTYDITVDLNAMTATIALGAGVDNLNAVKGTKIMENGKVFILINGMKYTVTGIRVE